MDFKKVYLGDYSDEGYSDNFSDGKEGNPRDKFKFFKAVNPINLVWNFDNSWETYQRSGDRGYIDGERVRHEMFGAANMHNKGVNMSTESYGNMIWILSNMKRQLKSIKGEILLRVNRNKEAIDELKSRGWVVDIANVMDTKHQQLKSDAGTLLTIIEKMTEQCDNSIKRIEILKQVAEQK